jgi:hypothetical protein
VDVHFWLDPKMHQKNQGCEEDGLTPSFESLKFLKLSRKLSGSDMRNFGRSASMAILDRLHPGGHVFKAERSFCQSLGASFIKWCVGVDNVGESSRGVRNWTQ